MRWTTDEVRAAATATLELMVSRTGSLKFAVDSTGRRLVPETYRVLTRIVGDGNLLGVVQLDEFNCRATARSFPSK